MIGYFVKKHSILTAAFLSVNLFAGVASYQQVDRLVSSVEIEDDVNVFLDAAVSSIGATAIVQFCPAAEFKGVTTASKCTDTVLSELSPMVQYAIRFGGLFPGGFAGGMLGGAGQFLQRRM